MSKITHIVAETGSELYLKAIKAVLVDGEPVSPRGMRTRELLNTTFTITDPTRGVPLGTGRRLNTKIGATEYVQLLGGFSSLTQLNLVSGDRFNSYADDGKLLGAYGPRVHAQLPNAVRLLAEDPDSRQAIVTIWQPDELERESRDVPCTLNFHFTVRDGKLCMATHMRSNDAWLGLPYDLFSFTRLQMTIAWALKLPVGSYTHHVGSFHLYEGNVEAASQLPQAHQNVDQPPALITGTYTRRSSDTPQLHVERLARARKVARALTFQMRAATGSLGKLPDSFDESLTWYRNTVPLLGTEVKLCVLGCQYEFINPRVSARTCPSCRERFAAQHRLTSLNKTLRGYGESTSYDELVKRQGGRCAICRRAGSRRLAIDHCHETNTFRGLLCTSCNMALGLVQDDINVLTRMIGYLNNNLVIDDVESDENDDLETLLNIVMNERDT